MAYTLSRWTVYAGFVSGIGVGVSAIAFTELFDVRMSRLRLFILGASVLSALFSNVTYMHMPLELHDFRDWRYYVTAYALCAVTVRFSDAVNLYHYVERLLIVTNRTHLHKYIGLVLLLQMPWVVVTFYYLHIAIHDGMIAWVTAINANWASYSACSFTNTVLKLFTAATDTYILYLFKKKGIARLGISKTRILRIFLSAVFAIIIVILWFPSADEASAVSSAMYQLLVALDCTVIIDFFSIDIQNALQG
ncbi:hypothetical protein BKA69DRAFT_1103085, partial [Paraphysoderma sedebokerense]